MNISKIMLEGVEGKMDKETAETIFKSLADEVAKYISESGTTEDLAAALDSRLEHLDHLVLSEQPENGQVNADISFHTDESLQHNVRLRTKCRSAQTGIEVQGTLKYGSDVYIFTTYVK